MAAQADECGPQTQLDSLEVQLGAVNIREPGQRGNVVEDSVKNTGGEYILREADVVNDGAADVTETTDTADQTGGSTVHGHQVTNPEVHAEATNSVDITNPDSTSLAGVSEEPLTGPHQVMTEQEEEGEEKDDENSTMKDELQLNEVHKLDKDEHRSRIIEQNEVEHRPSHLDDPSCSKIVKDTGNGSENITASKDCTNEDNTSNSDVADSPNSNKSIHVDLPSENVVKENKSSKSLQNTKSTKTCAVFSPSKKTLKLHSLKTPGSPLGRSYNELLRKMRGRKEEEVEVVEEDVEGEGENHGKSAESGRKRGQGRGSKGAERHQGARPDVCEALSEGDGYSGPEKMGSRSIGRGRGKVRGSVGHGTQSENKSTNSFGSVKVQALQGRGSEDQESCPDSENRSAVGMNMPDGRGGKKKRRSNRLQKQRGDVDEEFATGFADEEYFEKEFMDDGSVDEDPGVFEKEAGKKDSRKQKKKKKKKQKPKEELPKNDIEGDFGYSSRFVHLDTIEDNCNQGQFNVEGQWNEPHFGHGGYERQAPNQQGMRHGPREFRRSRPPRAEDQLADEMYTFDVQRSASSLSESSTISGTAHFEDYGQVGQHLTGLTITTCGDGRRHVQTSEGVAAEDKPGGRKRNKNRSSRRTSGQEQEQRQEQDPLRNANTHMQDLEVSNDVEYDVDWTEEQMPPLGRPADGQGYQRWQRERGSAEQERKGDYSALLEKSNKRNQHQDSETRHDLDGSQQRVNQKRKTKKSKNKFKQGHESQNQWYENNAGISLGAECLDEARMDRMSHNVERADRDHFQDDRKRNEGRRGHEATRGGRGRERTTGRNDAGGGGDAYRGEQRGRGQHHKQRNHGGQQMAFGDNSRGQQRRRGGGHHQGNERSYSPRSMENQCTYSPEGQTDQRYGGNQGGSRQKQWRHGQQQREGQQRRNQNRRQQKEKYESYWSAEAVSDGLKRGTLIEGPIRINPKSYTDAYVPLPDGTADIYIPGLLSRNRALNSDLVAIQLLDRHDWRVYTEELEQCEAQARSEERLAGGEGDEDSGPDVVIEEEKEELRKQGVASSEKKEERKKASTPRRCYTSVREVLSGGSPVAKSLFESHVGAGGDQGNTEQRVQVDSLLQKTGKVVAILEKKHSRAASGHIRLMNDKNPNVALFSPSDSRVPRIQVPMKQCPADFLERPGDHAKTLYIARITDWEENSVFAKGQLARSLGEAGEIEPETEAILIEHNVESEEFPQEVLNCLPQELPWQIPAREFEYRRDLRTQCIFTIDPATARDLDDAMSIELLDNGKYQVGVHIADVSFFIDESSHLDVKAAARATSVYLVQKVIPMLPRLLCEELCSLNPDADRLAFSVIWTMDQHGNVEEEWFGRTVIRSCVKLSYQHAQGFIEEPEREWLQEELPPISGSFSVEEIKLRVLQLDKIAKCLRKRRFDGGALRLDQVKLTFTLNQETGLPNGYLVYEQKDSNRLIEEFMLLANMAVAHRIYQHYPGKALLRRHPPPQNKMVDDLRDLCEQLGVALDLSNSQTWQESLTHYQGSDDFSAARMQVLVALSSKPMQNAKYFCSGMIEDTEVYRHYALNVPLYTHFTSPIRRYADVMVHRLLAASLEYSAETEKDCRQLHKQADHCNDKKYMAKRVQEMSSELYFAAFVREAGPFEEKGMVMGVMDHSFDVFILKFAVVKRIYCDQLDLKSKVYVRDHKKPQLTLVWRGNDTQGEVTQIIDIFTSVVVCMLGDKDPLKWKALLKRPSTDTARAES